MLSPLDFLFGLFSLDIGIDLGTAYTLVLCSRQGHRYKRTVICRCRIARHGHQSEVGARAKEMWSQESQGYLDRPPPARWRDKRVRNHCPHARLSH